VALVVVAAAGGAALGYAISQRSDTTTAGSTADEGSGAPASTSRPRGVLPAIDAAAIAKGVNPSVVDINTALGFQQASAAGTGMILTDDGEILTNNHVVDGATSITVTAVTTGRRYDAKVVGTDATNDVAVLRLEGASGLTPITVGRSGRVAVGDPVVAIGNAGGAGGLPSVVSGVVTALDQQITASDEGGANAETLDGLIEFDADIEAGDSGGPLADADGEVVGMTSAASIQGGASGPVVAAYAIPIADAMAIVRQIEAGRSSDTVHIGATGFLGIAVVPASQLGGTTSAPIVSEVEAGSPAADAGLEPGDAITSVEGVAIHSPQELSVQIQRTHPGDRIRLGWTDSDGVDHTATVTLATGPAS
jgi:S1-C subfamily serine protease